MAGSGAAVARVEVDRARGLKFSLNEHPPKADTGTQPGRDQKIVFADYPQACQMGGILEESAPILDLVWQRKGADFELFTHPYSQSARQQPHHTVSAGKAGDFHAPPVEHRVGCRMGQCPNQN